jgi:hypothetical protein
MNTYLKIFFILLIGILLTAFSYKFVRKGMDKYYCHKDKRLTEIFTAKANYDLLFLGSSRTHTTIVPGIIDSITGLTSYNAGVEGGSMLDFKMTLEGYLINHPPPIVIILTIDPGTFTYVSTVFDPMQYLKVSKTNKVVKKTLQSIGYNTFILQYIPMFNYIYMDDYSKSRAIAGLKGQTEIPAGDFEDKGYLSNSNSCLDAVRYRRDTGRINIDSSGINLFQSIIYTCKKRKISLILTYAPEYKNEFSGTITNFEEFIAFMDKKAKENNLLFYRDDTLSMNNDSCFFRDVRHVNKQGSFAYSKILGNRLLGLRHYPLK